METRANYVAVGVFTIVLLLAAFGFVFWTSGAGDKAEMVPVQFQIPGSASGLTRGSLVTFNGVRVGTISSVFIDGSRPDVALANALVDIATPVTPSTRAGVGIAGLTGTANIELSGGDPNEENVLRKAAAENRSAIIQAQPSQLSTLMETGESILNRVNEVVGQLEGFTSDAREPLTQSLQNVEQFTSALAANSDGIGDFLAAAGDLSETISGMSGTIEGSVKQIEQLLTAVNPEDLGQAVANVRKITEELVGASERVSGVIAQAETFVGELEPGAGQQLVSDATETLSSVRQVVANVEQRIDPIVTSLQNALQKTESILDGVESDDIGKTLANARQVSEQLTSLTERVDNVVAKADTFLGDVEPGAGSALVADARSTLSSLQEITEDVGSRIDPIVKSVQQSVERAEAILETVEPQEVEQAVENARELAERLNAASVRIDGILAKADAFMGGLDADAGNTLMTEAQRTLATIREAAATIQQTSNTLNSRIGPIAGSIQNFTDRGLKDVRSLITQASRSIERIERSLTDLGRNPQRIITGGEGEVRTYDGRQRR
ncbi:MlaD family protein [Notoacmeibacter sp. MSK16QG-6]|uniref:MlaD family protein n=1 Tax=Notoacmeibacter sp. MSK16QG-6 TaxID=2957982 RepID=UPI00209CE152|nr:MlaD family protein [Notoacmeibacter sp. MSK16QG-6]MCP1197914.1 MlaD family protein [Notoacmeibacter sp. MSK16QG-6]